MEPTAEMIALFDGLAEVDVYVGDTVPAILRDLLALVKRDQAPTQDAYDAAVRALEKHRQRAAIHADTLLTISGMLSETPTYQLREFIAGVIERGRDQIAGLGATTTRS